MKKGWILTAAIIAMGAVGLSAEGTDYKSATIGTLVYVPAGTFEPGSSLNAASISAFRIGANEITQAQYMAVMGGENPSTYAGDANRPVETINWYQAIAFCNALSLKEKLKPVYAVNGKSNPKDWGPFPTDETDPWATAVTADWTANGYRLPTSAEWQWAAMGASVESAPAKEGTVLGDYAWYAENSEMTTHPVGTKLPNALGIFDMMGNVGEWCGDWFEREPAGGTQADPKGPDAGKNRVMRGGAFNSRPAGLAVAFRLSAPPWLPGTRNFIIGFRVVRQ